MSKLIMVRERPSKLFTEIDDSDFDFVNQSRWHAHKEPGYEKFYVFKVVKNAGCPTKHIFLHRLLMGICDPKMHVDHLDGNPLNNKRNNLRICTNSQNQANRCAVGGSSRFKGVHFAVTEKKWVAAITKNRHRERIGAFTSELEAARAYDRRAIELFGEFAKLNMDNQSAALPQE